MTGNRYNLATGSVTIVAKAGIVPTGTQINVATTEATLRIWNEIQTGANQSWNISPTP